MEQTIMQHHHRPGAASPSNATVTDAVVDPATDGAVVEWAPFRLADGVSEAALLEASDVLQRDFLALQPGFVRRELLRGAGGMWSDLVIWRDEQSVQAAMTVAEQSATCLRYFSLLEGPSDAGAGVQILNRVRRY